jgi:hypothetical protein
LIVLWMSVFERDELEAAGFMALVSMSWYDLDMPRLGTTSVLHELRHDMKN